MKAHIRTGKEGEETAEKYLCLIGYHIRGRNVYLGKDEIDIVAEDTKDRVIVFAEVKTRSLASADYMPELNITREKKLRMQRAAHKWVHRNNYEGGYRIDVLCVAHGKVVEHIKDIEWE
jgi:putative endonuclease